VRLLPRDVTLHVSLAEQLNAFCLYSNEISARTSLFTATLAVSQFFREKLNPITTVCKAQSLSGGTFCQLLGCNQNLAP